MQIQGMQLQGFSPIGDTYPLVTEAGVKAKALFNGIQQFLGLQKPDPTAWESLNTRFWSALEYAPDVWSIMDSGLTLAREYAMLVPTHVRTLIAVCATLNLALLPTIIKATAFALYELLVVLPYHGLTGLLEGVARVTYLSSLASALAAVGSTGLHHFAQLFDVPTEHLERLVAAVIPWAGYTLRASAIFQAMDLWSGGYANSRLDRTLKPMKLSESLLSVLPRIKLAGRDQAIIMIKPSALYRRADIALRTLGNNQRVFRKVADKGTDLDATISKIQGRVHSWILPISWFGQLQAVSLARRLHARNVVELNSHAFGLTANLCAVMKIAAWSNVVAASVLGIFSALFYIGQTYYRHSTTVA